MSDTVLGLLLTGIFTLTFISLLLHVPGNRFDKKRDQIEALQKENRLLREWAATVAKTINDLSAVVGNNATINNDNREILERRVASLEGRYAGLRRLEEMATTTNMIDEFMRQTDEGIAKIQQRALNGR